MKARDFLSLVRRETRNFHPLIILPALGGAVFLIFLAVALAVSGPPSDESLVRQFREHRKEFELLREMLVENPKVAFLAEGDVSTNQMGLGPPEAAGVDAKRHAEYLSLLKRVGAFSAIRYDGEIRFPVAASGFASKGYRIAVTYRETEPAPLLESLDDFRKTKTGWEQAYRRLDGNWYLWIIW